MRSIVAAALLLLAGTSFASAETLTFAETGTLDCLFTNGSLSSSFQPSGGTINFISSASIFGTVTFNLSTHKGTFVETIVETINGTQSSSTIFALLASTLTTPFSFSQSSSTTRGDYVWTISPGTGSGKYTAGAFDSDSISSKSRVKLSVTVPESGPLTIHSLTPTTETFVIGSSTYERVCAFAGLLTP